MRPAIFLTIFAVSTVALAADGPVVTIGDNQNYTIGAYLAYMAPFNKGKLVAGSDYSEAMVIHPKTFPDDTLIKWQWPTTPCPKGIYNFDAIDFGNVNFTIVQSPIPPHRVGEVKVLTETHKLTLAGDLPDYDVITDMFLTTKPGDSSAKANEVELFWHTPPYSVYYFKHTTPAGTIAAAGRTWDVAVDERIKPHDVLVMPRDRADLTDVTVDVKAVLDALVARGIISPDLYFNGMALGSEVRARSGSLAIHRFAVTYK